MEAGKIIRPLRAFLGLHQSKDAKDRNPQQGGGGYSRQYPNRRPSLEEAETVQKWLSSQESILKNGLAVTLESKGDIHTLLIRDGDGKVLKTLLGDEIFRLLESSLESSESTDRGSILDRRV